MLSQGRNGGHLLSSISAHSYVASKEDVFMPLTARANSLLTKMSWRNSFAYNLRMARPAALYPDGEEEHWLPLEDRDFHGYIRHEAVQSAPDRPAMTFAQFHEELFGEAPSTTFCFAQGAQFAASRQALRRVPLSTYRRLLRWLQDERRVEAVYYLELTWPRLLLQPGEWRRCQGLHSLESDAGTLTQIDATGLAHRRALNHNSPGYDSTYNVP